ncbi:hypothetical protein L9F63_003361 [Diploptera punctata]|uniref:Ionotropic glutamate receptor C-terminal domain-containing protein n=1 Tax=Diploptera punctata TaxID=6984 RepID=A0AAD7ZKU2_DIPPU|nr:hypothetical protein L9F63_003361 [Diploptera punctata]
MWSWYTPCAVRYHSWESFFRIFTVHLWLLICASIFVLSALMFIIARISQEPMQYFRTLITCLFTIIGLMVGTTVSSPKGLPLRLFFFSVVCYFISISTVFQAWLTSFLTDPGEGSKIDNMEELLNSSLRFGYVPILEGYFTEGPDLLEQQIHEKRVLCMYLNECAAWVGKYRNFSFIYTQLLEKYQRSKSTFQQNTDKSLLCKIEDGDFLPITYGFSMLRDNPLLPFVNDIMLKIVESGLFLKWKDKSFEVEKIRAKRFIIPSLAAEYCSLGMQHMQPAFYFLFLGSGVAGVLFILEMSSLIYLKMQ